MCVKYTQRRSRMISSDGLWMGVEGEMALFREAILRIIKDGLDLFFSTCWLCPHYLCVFVPW